MTPASLAALRTEQQGGKMSRQHRYQPYVPAIAEQTTYVQMHEVTLHCSLSITMSDTIAPGCRPPGPLPPKTCTTMTQVTLQLSC